MKTDNGWQAEFFTIEEFADITPLELKHKEQESVALPKEAEERKNLHVLIRSSFYTNGEPLFLRITADDHYKLYIDGTFIQEGPAPAYPSHYYYNEIRLKPLLEGEHVLGIHLYYQGCINRVYDSGDLRLAVAAQLFEMQGMKKTEIPLSFVYQITDAYTGKTVGYDTQFLEDFDSRRFPAEWNQKGYDAKDFRPMVPAVWADYTLYAQPVKMLFHQVVKPQVIQYLEDGTIFIDAGKEITGALCLKAKGTSGSRILIRCGEECESSQKVRYDMRANCHYQEVFTLGEGESILEPYDYKGFRYANLILEEGITITEITLLVRHYPMQDGLCQLQSDQPELEQIFEICKNAVRCGTQEAYIDCPTREKGQYLGDAVVTAHAQVLLTGSCEMLLKCIDQFAQTAEVCRGLLAVAPGGLMQEIADFSLLYPQLLLWYYRYTKDCDAVRKYYHTVEEMIGYFKQYERADGLLELVSEKWNLVDWPENLRDGYDFALTRPVVGKGCHNIINALYIGAIKALAELAGILQQKSGYEERIPVLEQAFYHTFYRKDTGLFADSETSMHSALHANVYPLYFGIAAKEDTDKILDFIEQKGFSCGVMHSYFVLRTLAKYRRYDAVYRLLVNEGTHGWVNMLKEGATACFEAWGKEQKWNTSLCHPWASAPVPILIEEIAGIHFDPKIDKGYYFSPQIPDFVHRFRLQVSFGGKLLVVEKKQGNITLKEEDQEESYKNE